MALADVLVSQRRGENRSTHASGTCLVGWGLILGSGEPDRGPLGAVLLIDATAEEQIAGNVPVATNDASDQFSVGYWTPLTPIQVVREASYTKTFLCYRIAC